VRARRIHLRPVLAQGTASLTQVVDHRQASNGYPGRNDHDTTSWLSFPLENLEYPMLLPFLYISFFPSGGADQPWFGGSTPPPRERPLVVQKAARSYVPVKGGCTTDV